MATIFISYSSEDKHIVKTLAALLEAKGWTVWWDRKIPIGLKYDTVIENELKKADCVVVVWTKRSVQSEWVKNEANAAEQRQRLIPVLIEQVDIPLAFQRIESAMMPGWQGEADHPELEVLYESIAAMIGRPDNPPPDKNKKPPYRTGPVTPIPPPFQNNVRTYSLIAISGLIVSLLLVYYYLTFVQGKMSSETDQRMFYLILIIFGIACSAMIFGVMNTYATINGKTSDMRMKMTGPGVGVLLIVLGGLYLPSKPVDKTMTIRLFDHKKNPLTQGNVKIYLNEYIRSQSVDNMGQALFAGLPDAMLNNPLKIEVSCPGYTTRMIDTILTDTKPIELTLPLIEVVLISGRIKTAAEMPINGVEVNVDGTKYYAMSTTDGSYNLRLEEYTLGDEITITTSHEEFEDKTFPLKINSPDMKNQDIFLNPVSH